MKIKGILLSVVVLLSAAGVLQAFQTEYGNLGVDVEAGYVSKYLWHGFDVYKDGHSAFQPSVTLKFFDTGFSVTAFGSMANRSGFENRKEYDYILAYSNSFFAESCLKTDYKVNWIYYDLYSNPDSADLQEGGIGASWPNLNVCGIVPHYYFGKLWASQSNSPLADAGGFVHVFGVSYDLVAPAILPDNTEQHVQFSADVTYNDGYGFSNVDPLVGVSTPKSDWSHATFGIGAPLVFGKMTVTPEIRYQLSMEDTVNTEDEFVAGVTAKISF